MAKGATLSARRNATLVRKFFSDFPDEIATPDTYLTVNRKGVGVGLHPLTPNSAAFLVSFDGPQHFQVLTPGNVVYSDTDFQSIWFVRIAGADGSAGKIAYLEIADYHGQVNYGAIPPIASLSSAVNGIQTQATATPAGVLLLPNRPSRVDAYIKNLDPVNAVWIGLPGVAPADGFKLDPSDPPFPIGTGVQVNGVALVGTTVLCSMWEEYN